MVSKWIYLPLKLHVSRFVKSQQLSKPVDTTKAEPVFGCTRNPAMVLIRSSLLFCTLLSPHCTYSATHSAVKPLHPSPLNQPGDAHSQPRNPRCAPLQQFHQCYHLNFRNFAKLPPKPARSWQKIQSVRSARPGRRDHHRTRFSDGSRSSQQTDGFGWVWEILGLPFLTESTAFLHCLSVCFLLVCLILCVVCRTLGGCKSKFTMLRLVSSSYSTASSPAETVF